MIDNFNEIRKFLSFKDGDFYFLQIIKRRKDNPDLNKSEKLIDNFYIYSLKEFDNLKDKVIELCNIHNARAYFRLNRRNSEKIALQTLKKITDLIISKDYKAVKNIYPSVCGEFHSDPKKTWIIDIDNQESDFAWQYFIKVRDKFNSTHKTSRIEFLGTIPTKNGFHIIVLPFDVQWFNAVWLDYKGLTPSMKLPVPDIHKDNPTILYIP